MREKKGLPEEVPSVPKSPDAAQSTQLDLFVGRSRELEILACALEDARDGVLNLVVLVGEAGIGKTRLARRFAERASSQGVCVLEACLAEGQVAPAYGPWLAALARPRHGPTRARGQEPNILPPGASAGGRAAFFDTLLELLASMARTEGLLVVMDNAQWADPDSLQFLEYLAGEAFSERMMILLTARERELELGHPLSRVLGELVKLPSFRQLRLGGLDRADVEFFVRHAMGGGASPTLAETIFQRADGSPLFMVELVRDALAHVRPDAWQAPAPSGVRHVIARRFAALPVGCPPALAHAAVMGRIFDLRVLARLLEVTEDVVLALLKRARVAGLVEEADESPMCWQFTHAVVQETLYEETDAAHRQAVHGRTAELIEGIMNEDPRRWSGELLRHQVAGLGAGGLRPGAIERLVRVTLSSAEAAIQDSAPEKAVAFIDRTLAIVEGRENPGVSTADLGALFHLKGRALNDAGRHEGRECFALAYRLYVAAGQSSRAVDVALSESHALLRTQFSAVSAQAGPVEELRRSALRLVKKGSLAEARILASGFDPAEVARALQTAEGEGDTGLVMESSARLAMMHDTRGEFWESLPLWRRATQIAAEPRERGAHLESLYWSSYPLVIIGALAAARESGMSLLDNAVAARSRRIRWEAHYILATLAGLMGDWDDCRAHTDRVRSLGSPDAPTVSLAIALGNRALVETETGHPDAGREYLREFAKVSGSQGSAEPLWTVRIAQETGDLSGMEELARLLGPVPTADDNPFFYWNAARRVAQALVAILRGDVETAAACREYFLPWSGCFSPTSPAGRSFDSVLGLLASCLGEHDRAIGHFKDAMAFCARSQMRPELARLHLELAETLLLRGKPGDVPHAVRILAEGKAIARTLGMKPLLGCIEAKLAALGVATSCVRPEFYGLSPRELEVLKLIARGFTNREIGERLFISERTVASHVQNIFSKSGAANRAEVTAQAASAGLLDP